MKKILLTQWYRLTPMTIPTIQPVSTSEQPSISRTTSIMDSISAVHSGMDMKETLDRISNSPTPSHHLTVSVTAVLTGLRIYAMVLQPAYQIPTESAAGKSSSSSAVSMQAPGTTSRSGNVSTSTRN